MQQEPMACQKLNGGLQWCGRLGQEVEVLSRLGSSHTAHTPSYMQLLVTHPASFQVPEKNVQQQQQQKAHSQYNPLVTAGR